MATRSPAPAATPEALWTIEDVASRWGVGPDFVRRTVKQGLPHLVLGSGKGTRPTIRFRPEAVRAWEASKELARDPAAATTAATVGPAPVGHDGVDRLARGRKDGKARPG